MAYPLMTTRLQALAALKKIAIRVRGRLNREMRNGEPPSLQTITGLREIASEARRIASMDPAIDHELFDLAMMSDNYANDLESKRQRIVN
jgi:hypothetical protein